MELLKDPHTGTLRMDGSVAEWFDVHVEVRQACVIAPWLFNILMDFSTQWLKSRRGTDGKPQRDGCGKGVILELFSVLLFADDMVSVIPSKEELTVTLQVMGVMQGCCWFWVAH